MRKISLWARNNMPTAQALLVLCHILLAFIAGFIGIRLLENGIFLTPVFLYLSLAIWIIAVLSYPIRKKFLERKNLYYTRQKRADFAIALSTALVICYACNSGDLNSENGSLFAATTTVVTYDSNDPVYNTKDPRAAEILNSLKYRDKSTLTRKEKRILKQEFKAQLKLYVKAKLTGDKDGEGDTGLIILTIVIALGVLYLVAAIACNLSCNGMDGAAVAVALLGTVGVVWATIAIIRRIKNGPKKKVPAEEEEVK